LLFKGLIQIDGLTPMDGECETNLFFVTFDSTKFRVDIKQIGEILKKDHGVLCSAFTSEVLRFVVHYMISEEAVKLVIQAVQKALTDPRIKKQT